MDGDLYRRLVLEHKDRVHSYAAWLLGGSEDARDITQEALVRMWKHRRKVEPATARAWLLRTTYRLCIDRMRRRKVRGEVQGDDVFEPMPDPSAGPDRRATSGEIGDAISQALSRLSEADRTVVLLREVQGLAYNEIARILDAPIGTIKAKLHRARDRLRKELVAAGVQP